MRQELKILTIPFAYHHLTRLGRILIKPDGSCGLRFAFDEFLLSWIEGVLPTLFQQF